MARSGQELGEKAPRGRGGLRGDFAGRGAARLREELADQRDVGGFGKQFAIGADEAVFRAGGQGGRQIGFSGIWFEDELVRTAAGWRICKRYEKLAWRHNFPEQYEVPEAG